MPKVAIFHDWLYGGGAEQVIEELHRLYPDAPIYTSYCSAEWRKKLDGVVVTGYLQHWPFSKLRRFLPLLRQQWFRSLKTDQYDIVISSSGNGEAKFITTNDSTLHVCYCHTPTHFYWSKYEEYLAHPSMRPYWLARLGLRLLVRNLRKKDFEAAQNVDYFIANSTHTQKQIKKYYERDSTVIFPPVDIDRFSPLALERSNKKNTKHRYITWGRHVPYKRLDLAIAACNKLQLPLTILGTGPQTAALAAQAGPTITFTGHVSNQELQQYILDADTFLFLAEEDFGIAPVEALSAGLPVIAYGAGGALDYIDDGSNGLFIPRQTKQSLVKTLKRYQTMHFNPVVITKSAEAYSKQQFNKAMPQYINRAYREFKS